MNNKNEILNELRALAPTLASISKQNCFSIPENYFLQGMPRISTVSDILKEKANHSKNDLMYLDLMSEILADNFANIARVKTFKVPNNYFTNLTEDVVNFKNSVLAIEDVEGSTTLDEAFQVNRYTVPQNYFSSLPETILNKLKSESVSEVDEALSQHLDKKVFATPKNYFENLPQNILQKVNTTEKSAKIISLKTLRNVLAIAATLALFVAGTWFLNADKTGNSLSIDEQISKISAADVKNYIASNAYQFEDELLSGDLLDAEKSNEIWQIDLNVDDLEYYLNDINEYNLNI